MLGTRFRVNSPTVITALRWYKATSEANTARTAHIYEDATGTRVASVTFAEQVGGIKLGR